jgi:hypothetical protein
MMAKLATEIIPGSEWYVIDMKWINKWQKFVNFEGEKMSDDEKV